MNRLCLGQKTKSQDKREVQWESEPLTRATPATSGPLRVNSQKNQV